MAADDAVVWVRPPEAIRGLDHLGVQAPCIALYGQLLPGITNVTDRARYYSFHPWLVWAFERRYTDHSLDEFRRVLRRAECLFALIAIRHARMLDDGDDGLHGRAMVGRDQLLKIEEDGFALDDYAQLEGDHRYFKNKLGGLGQYYFGPLRDLRVLDHSPQGTGYPPGYDRERGQKLAEAFAGTNQENAFFHVLEQPTTTWQELDELSALCPCGLLDNPAEHELLLDLFLARSECFRRDNGAATRRASLGLMLDLAGQSARDPEYAFEGLLRGSAYTGALVDGSAWHVADTLQRVLRGWGTYQRNELLSIAVQGLFAAILRAIERDEGGRIGRASDAADVAVRLLSSLGADLKLPLGGLVTRVRGRLPALADWKHEDHELQHGWRLQSMRLDDANLEEIARESIEILLALLARGVDECQYTDFEIDPEYFDPREINLVSLRLVRDSDWSELTVEGWIRWVAVQWGIARHLRVALRKLHGERRDTFRIRPLEGELRVVEAPAPVFTIPRVSRAQQILRDLGLVEYDDEGVMVLTERGQIELEACRVG